LLEFTSKEFQKSTMFKLKSSPVTTVGKHIGLVKNSVSNSLKYQSNIKGKKNIPGAKCRSQIIMETSPKIGMAVEVKWIDGETYSAKILDIKGNECLVHYKGWNSSHDEWISSKKLATPKIQMATNPKAGMEVQVQWTDGVTYEAKILVLKGKECLVHYKGWNERYDEWLSTNKGISKRIFLRYATNSTGTQKGSLYESVVKKSITTKLGSFQVVGTCGSDDDDPEMVGLCEYEKIRLRNIRERQALFEELNLSEAKDEVSLVFTPKSLVRKLVPAKKKPRRSSRISYCRKQAAKSVATLKLRTRSI